AVADGERDLLELRGPRTGNIERVAQRDRLAEAHARGADVASLSFRVCGQPAEALGLLARSRLFGGHRADLFELLVGDRRGNEVDVVGAAVVERGDEVAQKAVTRRAQLARPAASALDVPLEVEALGDEVAEVLAHGELVDRVVAEAAPDEDEPRALAERADRPERHVAAADDVVARKLVRVERLREHERVRVRAVGGEEHERVSAAKLSQLLEPGGIDVDGPRVLVK